MNDQVVFLYKKSTRGKPSCFSLYLFDRFQIKGNTLKIFLRNDTNEISTASENSQRKFFSNYLLALIAA